MKDLHDRLQEILEAYGATPERWPEEERDALVRLLDRSPEARAKRDDAGRLDALLDASSGIPPARADLFEKIVAQAPRAAPPVVRFRRWAAVIPIAAAAAIAVWIARTPEPSAPAESMQIATMDLGVYETATDVWLDIDGFDPLARVPDYDCSDEGLGCMDLDLVVDGPERHSKQGDGRRIET